MEEKYDLDEIVAGCQKRDSDSFSRLIDIFSKRMYGYFYRLSGNREISDDLLSELFVKLVVKIGSYKGGSFEGWLFKIASNLFHDYLRSKHKHEKLVDRQIKNLEPEQEKITEKQDDRIDKLQVQLVKLDDDTKELIMLRFYSKLSFEQIAAARGEPIGTSLSKLHRGLKKLRLLME